MVDEISNFKEERVVGAGIRRITGKIPNLAERIMRDVVKKVVHLRGRGNPDLLRIMLLLQGWLRELGRGDDADNLKREIAELIGPDNLDI